MMALLAALALAWSPQAPKPGEIIQTTVSASDLVRMCSTSRDLLVDPCNSFIWGVADGLAAAEVVCPPMDGWTLMAPRLVKKLLNDDPTVLSTSGGLVVYQALVKSFPCERPK
jgi:hypothetical protein